MDGSDTGRFDIVVVGGTPGGITAAVAAARRGLDAVVLERYEHVGGLPANGLGATDIATRGATGGLFQEFVDRVHDRYADTYGPDSQQVTDCSEGYHFEPSVAEAVFAELLDEAGVTVRRRRQFDADPDNVTLEDGSPVVVGVTDREERATERYAGEVFVDATYEGDLAAAAGAPYRLGREGSAEYDEPFAGVVYKQVRGPTGPGATGLGDNAVQSYNYRLCLTRDPDNRVPIEKPDGYDRSEYVSIVDDVMANAHTDVDDSLELAPTEWILLNTTLPNGKVDANNHGRVWVSTDLPEENWPWPSSSWAWRDRFAERLREYTLGLLWFAQHDPELPEAFREQARQWGLAADEYEDNDNFPRQVYVREGRRIEGEHLFTAHDALPVDDKDDRPPVYADSITASHYNLDSHAVRKREPGRVHLDGFLSKDTRPYTVPYGVMVPKGVDGLVTPVPVSGTHLGYSTLRMEPCWMALGQAAGVAAAHALASDRRLRDLPAAPLQRDLLDSGAVLIHYEDVAPEHPAFPALQFFGVRGFVPGWEARLDAPVTGRTAADWTNWAGVDVAYTPGETDRGALLEQLYDAIAGRATDRPSDINAPSSVGTMTPDER